MLFFLLYIYINNKAESYVLDYLFKMVLIEIV